VITVTVFGRSPCAQVSLARLALPASPSTSSTKIPLTGPVATPMLAFRNFLFRHHRRISTGLFVRSLRQLTSGALPGLLPASFIEGGLPDAVLLNDPVDGEDVETEIREHQRGLTETAQRLLDSLVADDGIRRDLRGGRGVMGSESHRNFSERARLASGPDRCPKLVHEKRQFRVGAPIPEHPPMGRTVP
jgi:hypothetical protein